ncbi:hypothetical protein J6590_053267 [Homalodisca vitripennis]|nr:hypothetical protein J6590_053267 [Homalodisca vitripennis]
MRLAMTFSRLLEYYPTWYGTLLPCISFILPIWNEIAFGLQPINASRLLRRSRLAIYQRSLSSLTVSSPFSGASVISLPTRLDL